MSERPKIIYAHSKEAKERGLQGPWCVKCDALCSSGPNGCPNGCDAITAAPVERGESDAVREALVRVLSGAAGGVGALATALRVSAPEWPYEQVADALLALRATPPSGPLGKMVGWEMRHKKTGRVSFIEGAVDPREVHDGSNAWEYYPLYRGPVPESSLYLVYDKTYGDDKPCACGHPYYRHFDTHDNMAPVGCKYCDCRKFQPKKADDA